MPPLAGTNWTAGSEALPPNTTLPRHPILIFFICFFFVVVVDVFVFVFDVFEREERGGGKSMRKEEWE